MPDLFSTVSTGVSKDFDPDPSSLFNVMTMRELCKLGASVPNIMTEPNETLNKTFTLQEEWHHLAKRLNLKDDRHLYFLWLWMEHIFKWDLKPSSVHKEVPKASPPGMMSREGSQALKTSI